MRLRKTYIVEDETTNTTGTKVYNLDFTDPIRAIIIGFYGKRYDMTDANNPLILRDIDKIEIVDGSDVIYSLTGTQAGAVQLYQTGKRIFMWNTANSNSSNRNQVKLLFGRDENDTEFALDLTHFNNPQLKITHSYTEGTTGNWASGTQTITVAAIIAEGAPKPRGFFMTKEIYSWTKGTSGEETIDLPRDLKYRFIVLQAKDCATPLYAEFTKIKISCNFDEFVPINETTEDLMWENIGNYGMLNVLYEAVGDGSDVDIKAYNQMAYNSGCNVSSWNTGQSAVEKRPYSGYSTLGRKTCPDSSGADFISTYLENAQRVICNFTGWNLFDTEVIPFGDINAEVDWFDPKPWKSVRLILTQAQTAVDSSIVIQQVRLY